MASKKTQINNPLFGTSEVDPTIDLNSLSSFDTPYTGPMTRGRIKANTPYIGPMTRGRIKALVEVYA